MIEKSLDMLTINKIGRVKKILDCSIKRRFLDLGFTYGTEVKNIMSNFSKNMNAYYIRGTLIAIRNEDARNIIVEVSLDE